MYRFQEFFEFDMFITAFCFLFLNKLRWPKNKNIYQTNKFWKSKDRFRCQTDKFFKSKNHFRYKTDKFWSQRIVPEIKRKRQESKHLIILVILLEHCMVVNAH